MSYYEKLTSTLEDAIKQKQSIIDEMDIYRNDGYIDFANSCIEATDLIIENCKRMIDNYEKANQKQ